MTSIVALVPNVVLITLMIVIMVWFLLAKTQFGQHLYAIGGNYQAAVRAGIPVNRTLIKAFVITAMLSGIAGALWASRFTSGDSNAGVPTLLYAIAAVVVGGASMFGNLMGTAGMNIGERNVQAVRRALEMAGIPVVADDTGSDYGRSVFFFLDDGRVEVRSLRKGSRVL